MTQIRSLFLCVISFLFLIVPAHASVTGYIKIPDIDGESRAADHEDEIDILSIDWGMARGLPEVGSSGSVDITLGSAYPGLAEAVAAGKSFDEVIIHVRKDSGDAHLDYLKVTLTDCIVSRYEPSAASTVGTDRSMSVGSSRTESAGGMATEEITLNYTKIKYEY